jgi:hypothetical protein
MDDTRRPLGIALLGCFCVFGASMSGLASVTLLWPGTPLDRVWVINPEGHVGLAALGSVAAYGMAALSVVMVTTAAGVFLRRRWAWWSAVVILVLNGCGDLGNAVLRHDPKTLIGVPLAVAVFYWMTRPRIRAAFSR